MASNFLVQIRSKNHSLNPLRGAIRMPVRSIVRFGSTTSTATALPRSHSLGRTIVEINTVEAIENSRSKLKMKKCFSEAGIKHSRYFLDVVDNPVLGRCLGEPEASVTGLVTDIAFKDLPYPIVAKRVFGFKGHGMVLLEKQEDLEDWLKKTNTSGYYFEQFHNYNREYRLHCTEDGCFYAVRKMLASDTPEDDRWYRNDSNCIWVTEFTVKRDEDNNIIGYDEATPNPTFDKPSNWEEIETDCVKALKAVGLHIGAFDVRVQSAKNSKGRLRDKPEYIIIEVNSAPSFGELTTEKYMTILPDVINKEYQKLLV